MSSSSSASFLVLLCVALFTIQSLTSPLAFAQDPSDPCEAACCSRGWQYYGTGNFSKLGVNGSSDCNCFDSPVSACKPSRSSLFTPASPAPVMSKKGARGRGEEPDHCLGACCSAGHAFFGRGDYARLDTCNCAMDQPAACSDWHDRLKAERRRRAEEEISKPIALQ